STNTPVGVYAANGAARDHQEIPALTIIGAAAGVNAAVPGASASTRLNPNPPSGHGGIVISESGGVQLLAAGSASAGTTASMPPAAVVPGPHSLLLRV